MASYQRSIENAFKQLRDLSASQRLAIAFGVMLVAGSLVWMGQWAATPEMTPLLNQTLSAEDIAQIRVGLTAIKEPFKVEGSQVLVRADANLPSLWASLGQMDKLPSDTSQSFAQMVKDANPWLPQEENDRRWTVAQASELERMIRQLSAVKDAKVQLNLSAKPRSFSRIETQSKASVVVIAKGGEQVTRSLAIAVARLVSGALRDVPMKNVEVVDGSNNRAALDWESDDPSGGGGLAMLQQKIERETADKIEEQLSYDRNVRVSVQAVIDRAARTEAKTEPIEGVPTEEINTEQSSTKNKAAAGGGVQANTGATADAGGNDGEATKSTSTETRFQPGVTSTTTTNPAGSIKQVFAAIALSHSYLESIHKKRNPDAKAATEADIQKIFDEQKTRIENQVAKLVFPPDAKQVAVDWYYDAPIAVAAEASTASMEMGLEVVTKYGPASGLGLLALLSLGLVMKMAKQRTSAEMLASETGLPKEVIEAARRAAEGLSPDAPAAGGRRGAGGGASGAAGHMGGVEPVMAEPLEVIPLPMGTAAEGVLDAQEVDEGTVQIHKMIEQVNHLTGEDDEAIASLVEKWVDQLPQS